MADPGAVTTVTATTAAKNSKTSGRTPLAGEQAKKTVKSNTALPRAENDIAGHFRGATKMVPPRLTTRSKPMKHDHKLTYLDMHPQPIKPRCEWPHALLFAALIALPFVLYFAFVMKP